jgi:hypothetical protein
MMRRPRKMSLAGTLKALTLMLISLGAGVAAVAAPPEGGSALFEDAAAPERAGELDEQAVVRSRLVEPDLDLLTGSDAGAPAAELRLNLFDDALHAATLDRVETNRSGGLSWIGRLQGVPNSSVFLVVRDEVLVGDVAGPGVWYRIRYVRDGVHAIQEMDPATFPAELEPLPAAGPPESGGAAPEVTADDGSSIDVLVVYTDDARGEVGGTTAIEALIDLAVAETNQSYLNSQITQRLNLVDTAELAYDESSFDWSTTLSRLRGPSDGYLDAVHSLRDGACADEVVLLVKGDGVYCGMAYQMASVGTYFADWAFAVVATNCATGYYSFGHELGHNMGARHDWYENTETTPYSYSHGFVNSADRWRTVMAYDLECSDQGFNCARLPYWSNPEVFYGGDPMGVPGGTSTGCTAGTPGPACDADNHRTLDNTAATVANFRDSAVCNPAGYTISGTVRDPSGDGAAGVTVDFGGARPAVTTGPDGYYSQAGFEDGEYTVGLSRSKTFFSPVLDSVTVDGEDAGRDALAYTPIPSRPPVSETFESGALGDSWAAETDYEGRVRVEEGYPHGGNRSLLLDSETAPGSKSHASGILALSLAAMTEVSLTFWWEDLADEDDPDDGVFISEDHGLTWHQAFSFSGYPADQYRQDEIDLVAAAGGAGIVLNDHFLVKFQFYGDYPISTDGYAIDDVQVAGTSLYVYLPMVLMTD